MSKAKKALLDATQIVAFDRALKCPLSLCQGPPGTGKTHVPTH